jgi:hypothetical protein
MMGLTTVLLNSGIDAFSNLYDVFIYPPTSNASPVASVYFSVRAMEFQPPELYLATTQVDYKSVQLTRQTPQIEGERKFQIKFRLDSDYHLYDALLRWKHIWVDPSGGTSVLPGGLSDNFSDLKTLVSNQTDNKYGRVVVKAYNASTNINNYSDLTGIDRTISALWEFKDVICMKVGTPSFQRNNPEAVIVTAEFLFGRMLEPNTGDNALTVAATEPAAEPAAEPATE